MWLAALRAICGVLLCALLLAVPSPVSMPDHYPANVVHYIVIHHAASGAPDSPDALAPSSGAGRRARQAGRRFDGRTVIETERGLSIDIDAALIDKMHKARGYDGIGYNYVVRFDGTIEKGRAEDLRGAHARAWDARGVSYNASSIGICFAGNCDAAGWTVQQQAAGYRLMLELMRRYGVPPERVIGHRECGNNTHCPGELINMDAVRAKLRKLREQERAAAPTMIPVT